LPYDGGPKLNGLGVAYRYADLQPVADYGIFVAGIGEPAARRQALAPGSNAAGRFVME
jgi:hypothetical protein